MKQIAAAVLVVMAWAQTPGQPAAPRRPVPVAANTVASGPDAFYGQIVSVTAAVDRSLSGSTFVIDQDRTKSTTHELLVIVPTLNAPVVPNSYVTVVGELVPFDPAEIARRAGGYKLDLAPELIARYQGRPAILATAVVNAASVDLARRLPRPMSPQEEAFDKAMKRIGPAFNGLRTAAGTSNAADAAGHAKTLKDAFAEAEAFWKARATADALDWTRAARRQVDAIERAVGSGNWEQVKTSIADVNQMCSTCHTAYRERLEDGTFQLKTGG